MIDSVLIVFDVEMLKKDESVIVSVFVGFVEKNEEGTHISFTLQGVYPPHSISS